MNERAIFIEILEVLPARRAAHLDAACAGDPALRERVEALLRSHDEAGEFLNRPVPERLADGPVVGPSADETRTGPPDGREGLDFLSASDKPGSLGRLSHYEVREVVGRGGMGVVLKAFDENLHRVVAVKVLAPQLAVSATARQRFVREARAAAAVTHDHVVTIHAVDETGGLPYLVMQYVDGVSLQDRLDRTGPLRLAEVLRIGMQAAAGLAAAHKQGLVHRDVKPANILLENGVERVKITDFGLARATDDASLTQAGTIAGTPQYMSPEQAEGKPVDARSDLFSLGSVLYAMCAGVPPFRGSTGRSVLKRVVEQTPPPVREANPEVPEWLGELIAKLHAKDPADRYQSAAEVAEILGRHLAHLQHPPRASAQAAKPDPGPTSARFLRPRKHRWASAAAVLVLLTAGLGLTEASGVTRVRATVIRIFTPDGTLVVEADDPDVKITIEGDGGLVITGAGPQEVRLKPGSYRVQAAKDGKPVPVERDLVVISRGGKEVVKVRMEAAAHGPAARPEPLTPGEVRRFEGHTGPVWSVTFSRDARRAISAGQDSCVRVWDVESGKQLRTFEGHKHVVYCVAASPDGRQVLSGSGRQPLTDGEGAVCLWELESGRELKRLDTRNSAVTSVAFSKDGSKALIGYYDGGVLLWDVKNWTELKRFEHKPGIWSVCLSADERTMVSAGGHEDKPLLRAWDVASGTPLRDFEGHTTGIWRAALAPDGKHILSAGADRTVRLWEVGTGKEVRRFRAPDCVTDVAFSADGNCAISSNYGVGNTISLWDVGTGAEVHALAGQRSVQSVALSPDGRLALSGGHDNMVRLWELPAKKK